MVMDPISCADGHTYKRNAIEQWLQLDTFLNEYTQPAYTGSAAQIRRRNKGWEVRSLAQQIGTAKARAAEKPGRSSCSNAAAVSELKH